MVVNGCSRNRNHSLNKHSSLLLHASDYVSVEATTQTYMKDVNNRTYCKHNRGGGVGGASCKYYSTNNTRYNRQVIPFPYESLYGLCEELPIPRE